MSKKTNLISFLFGESQGGDKPDSSLDVDLARLFEASAKEEGIISKKTPLAKALKKLGLDVELELDPGGFSVSFENGADYQVSLAILAIPDNMHTLATMGWVFARRGDTTMAGDVPDFRIRFMDVSQVEAATGDKTESLRDILKKAQEYATTPVEADAEDDVFCALKDGVGEQKDGASAENTIGEGVRALCTKDHGSFRMGDLYHVESLNGECHVFQYAAGRELSESLTGAAFDQFFTVAMLSGAELANQMLESGGDIIKSARSRPTRRLGTCSKCGEEKSINLPFLTCDACKSSPPSRRSKPTTKKADSKSATKKADSKKADSKKADSKKADSNK